MRCGDGAARRGVALEEGRRRRPRARSPAWARSAVGVALSASRRRKLAASAAGSFLRVCGIEGWTRRRRMPGTVAALSPAKCSAPPPASPAMIDTAASGAAPPPAGQIAEPRRQRRHQHGEKAETVDPDDRGRLQHGEPAGKAAGPGIADEVPRKAGQHVAAQPLRARPSTPQARRCAPCRRDSRRWQIAGSSHSAAAGEDRRAPPARPARRTAPATRTARHRRAAPRAIQ